MTMNASRPAPYQDTTVPVDDRIQDLLSRMTVHEKARQLDMLMGSRLVDKMMSNTQMAPDGKFLPEKARALLGDVGIGSIHDLYPNDARASNEIQKWVLTESRLAIPALFIEEGLHGFCGTDHTIFPHCIGLAGTWNPQVVQDVAKAIAAEMRASGVHVAICPVLGLAREPRWGRVEETFGEDVHLASRMAVAYVKGMQGDDLTAQDAVIAEPKHFAAHSVSEAGLNIAPVHVGERELRAEFLRVFEAAFVEGGAMAAMCAYSEIDGVPCAANDWLLKKVLREEWGFKGFVISDLGAIRQLHSRHHTAGSPQEAVWQSIAAGMDMQFFDYDSDFFQGAIVEGIEKGQLAVEDLDRAVGSVLRAKFLLGLFETPYVDTGLIPQVHRSERHKEISLDAARQSLCLLKNENALLPLRKDLGTIAVIGPNADVLCSGRYAGPGDGTVVTLLDGIRFLVDPNTEVRHVKGTGILAEELSPIPKECLFHSDGETQGLHGSYWPTNNAEGNPLFERSDSQIDFDWIASLPGPNMPPDGFAVQWTGKIVPDFTGEGLLGVASRDKMRLWVDKELVADAWNPSRNTATVSYAFEEGKAIDIRVHYEKSGSGVQVLLGWNQGVQGVQAAAHAAKEADVAVVAVGGSTQTCGESRDRADLGLPGRQLDLVRAVHATGTPTVLVLQNGRPLTVSWEAEHIPAILEAWYPAEFGGTAIAEALFGDINPGGKLPITFPKSVGQIPNFYCKKPSRFNKHIDEEDLPLYPFGFGLSYTTFEFSELVLTPEHITTTGTVRVSVKVINSGERDGDEVVQLYVNDLVSSVTTPEKLLKAFERIYLKAGETRTVLFTLGPKDLQLLNREMEWVVEPGQFEIRVGGSSNPDLRAMLEVTRS